MDSRQAAILDFWFREVPPSDWFGDGAHLDPVVRENFGTLHAQAARGDLDDWAVTPLGRLALILLLDQFPRHIHRGSAQAFAADPKAQQLVLEGIAAGEDEALSLDQRQFYYMPLMHAEDPALQATSIERFTALRDVAETTLSFARQHGEDIRRFGRFPYRNEALGRLSTPEEDEHMRLSPG
ncbi:DUF924 family protein [Novosphingobium terrae]|uniref:DUF924 family protein n=1 Tax=Novosphingobium terrae TaxID=2726189 RepID=UPI00197DD07A|nr:DUF924 family protein [Novosphingobium terrae]